MNDAALVNGMILDRFYLRRLWRFARLCGRPDVAAAPELQRLAGRATLTAYRDCVAMGLEREARELLDRVSGRRAVPGGN
jgi:hypothetical protein